MFESGASSQGPRQSAQGYKLEDKGRLAVCKGRSDQRDTSPVGEVESSEVWPRPFSVVSSCSRGPWVA